jgi:glycosyltransferase involved in cell wall biosynthesis
MFKRINQLIDDLGIRDIIEFHHELSDEDLREVLLTSSCVVIPSYSEGFCFAAAEAVAMGIPIISSGRGALVETVGGRFLEMRTMTTQGLTDSLVRALEKDYDYRPPTTYHKRVSVKEYQSFYQDTIVQEDG